MDRSGRTTSEDELWRYPFHEFEPSPLRETWPIPDWDTMDGRWKHRNRILEETGTHLRIHPHDGLANTGRNIMSVLMDRQVRGARGLTTLTGFRRSKALCDPDRDSVYAPSVGERSPSTVLESPALQRTPEATNVDDRDTNNQSLLTPTHHECLNEGQSPRVTYPIRIASEIRTFGEYCTATKFRSSFLNHLGGDDVLVDGNRPASSHAVSTISIAFSPDGHTMASTHGDHTVKLSCCTTGRLLESLEGHPRTPWTVKYHPSNSTIVASGCLGHQVRVWNWTTKSCLQMIRLEFAIISISFHPSGSILAIANGTRLHFWGVDDCSPSGQDDTPRVNRLTEMDQRHMLRCVHFPPDGETLIIGGVNPVQEDPRRRRNNGGIGGNGMSFYLRLWDFDSSKALELQPESDASSHIGMAPLRRAICNPRTFVPRALLYNDGGFDVSPDGRSLCACAEYWLPEGVDNAMDLLRREELLFEEERERDSLSPQSPVGVYVDATPNRTSDPGPTFLAAESHGTSAALGHTRRANANIMFHGRSPSFREGMEQSFSGNTPATRSPETHAIAAGYVPRTPPVTTEPQFHSLSPPPPPGIRFGGGPMRHTREAVSTRGGQLLPSQTNSGGPEHHRSGLLSTPPPPPPPPPPAAPGGPISRPPHPLSVIASLTSNQGDGANTKGRYVPHVVTVSLDTSKIPEELRDVKVPRGKPPSAVAKGYRPRLGQLLEAHPLDANKASAVTCVKFSPSTDFCLIGYGVREPVAEGGAIFHPVTAVYRVRGGMTHVSTMLSADDDVNIARFHPDPGHSFIYGTKQGRVRVLSPRPWNFYNN